MHIGLLVQTKGQRLKTIVLYKKRCFTAKRKPSAIIWQATSGAGIQNAKDFRIPHPLINPQDFRCIPDRYFDGRPVLFPWLISPSFALFRALASTLPTFILFAACLKCFYGFRSYWWIKKNKHTKKSFIMKKKYSPLYNYFIEKYIMRKYTYIYYKQNLIHNI
jgi:hypothetical protein